MTTGRRSILRRSGLGAAAMIALVVGACGSHSDDLEEVLAGYGASSTATAVSDDEADGDAIAETTTTTTVVTPTSLATDGPAGTRDDPLAFDVPAAVQLDTFGDADGSVWNVTVSAPRDVTDAVLARNPFNDPPPTGAAFVGFEVEMTLAAAGKEPLSPLLNFSWEIIGGATATAYDASTLETGSFGCGVTPDDFGSFDEVFIGGTLLGLVCIPLPVEDLGAPGTAVAMRHFSGARDVFGPAGTPGVAAPVPPPPDDINTGSGDGTRQSPHRFTEPADITLDTFGDADGSVWRVEIQPPEDITDTVLGHNQFNEPPPDGVRFVGFRVRAQLVAAGKEPLAPSFNFAWEILGGATRAVYRPGTIETDNFGCGPTPDEFEDFREVFVDGVIEGWVCIPLPIDDLDHPSTQVAIHHSADSRSVFGVGG